MKSKTPEQIAEIARLKKELKDVKRLLADEILDHRIDIATLEVASCFARPGTIFLTYRRFILNKQHLLRRKCARPGAIVHNPSHGDHHEQQDP